MRTEEINVDDHPYSRSLIVAQAKMQGEPGWRLLECVAPHESLARAVLAYRDEIAEQLSPKQRENLQHALGHSCRYRNHFVCGTDNTAEGFVGWSHMVELGIAVRGFDPLNGGRDAVFHATPFGMEVARVLILGKGSAVAP